MLVNERVALHFRLFTYLVDCCSSCPLMHITCHQVGDFMRQKFEMELWVLVLVSFYGWRLVLEVVVVEILFHHSCMSCMGSGRAI